MAGTHSSKPLTFVELTKEAFGFGLHPWEFYEYTLQEYLWMREGRNAARLEELRQDFRHVRVLAYYMISDKLKPAYRNKSIFDVVPDFLYEEEKPVDKDWYKKLMQKYAKAVPYLEYGNSGNRHKDNRRRKSGGQGTEPGI